MTFSKRNPIKIDIPEGIKLDYSELYDYDPASEFSEEMSLKYLSEDLFQATFDEGRLIIDMGWYGDLEANEGQFKILLVYASDWDFPVTTLYATSLDEVTKMMDKLLKHMVSDDFA